MRSNIIMNTEQLKEFTDDLLDYVHDHKEHFDCYPIDFEWRGTVYDWDIISPIMFAETT
tara:strand:- start:586 stop:762 length:177 start_codon:yes stop_codon:yes gene_type:complete